MKLLIVEDDLGLHSQYKWELEEFDTTFATDRDSAIEAIQKTQRLSESTTKTQLKLSAKQC